MMTADFSEVTKAYNREMQTMADKLGLYGGNSSMGARFVGRQAGLLSKALSSNAPPKDRKKTAQNIKNRVTSRIDAVRNSSRSFNAVEAGGKAGRGDVRWYAWSSKALYGVAQENDMRKASDQEVYKLYFKLTSTGRIRSGKHGKQNVFIRQRTLIKDAQRNRLIKRLQNHIGRLKAGWAVTWKKLMPAANVPEWVNRHTHNQPRGYSIDGLGVPGFPTFTIANFAKGATSQDSRSQVAFALRVRIRSMAADLKLFLKGVKRLEDMV